MLNQKVLYSTSKMILNDNDRPQHDINCFIHMIAIKGEVRLVTGMYNKTTEYKNQCCHKFQYDCM